MNTETEYCEAPGRPWILGENEKEKKAVVFRPPCKRWSCPVCSEDNSRYWQLRAFRGADMLISENINVELMTLTARGGKNRTFERTLQDFQKSWPKLSRRLQYANIIHQYIAIPEQHEDGTMHMHLIITNYQNNHWLHDNAYQCGLGFEADSKPVWHGAGAAAYVAKYTGKQFIGVTWPAGFRRVRASRNWPDFLENLKNEDWQYEAYRKEGALRWEIAMLEDYGYNVRISESAVL